MADANFLFEIPLYRIGNSNNWISISAMSIDNESFSISGLQKQLFFTDEKLEKNEEGKIILDLRPLELEKYNPNDPMPKEAEFPLEIYEARKEKRRLAALAKDAISIIHYKGKTMYFYLENGKLRILHGENEVTADSIEVIHGRKAVRVEDLELGHPFYELPVNVAAAFETVLKEQELKGLCLVSVGLNLLDGFEYFRFNVEPKEYMLEAVKQYFEFYEELNGFTGLVTAEYIRVSFALGVPYRRNN